MFATDKDFQAHGSEWIEPFCAERVGAIGCDLTARAFYAIADDNQSITKDVQLEPLESVFVGTEEVIAVPADMAAVVHIRNSRLRQGLHLDAPIYQPGHKTRVFFRVTNLSNAAIKLTAGDRLAAVSFCRLAGVAAAPYGGTFADEFDFRGLGGYTAQYKSAIAKADAKLRDVKQVEHDIYANVMVILSIFIALFSLIIVNISIVQNSVAIKTLLIFNLSTLASVAALIGFVSAFIGKRKINCPLLIAAAICIAAAVGLGFIM